MMRFALLLPLLSLAACLTATPLAPIVAETGGVCRNATLGSFVGRPASAALGSEMLAAAGARNLRCIAKGAKVTMEFRDDRLSVRLDGANRVESVACG